MRILTNCKSKDVGRIVRILDIANDLSVVSLTGEIEDYQTKVIKCPEVPSSARTAIYLMQLPRADGVIVDFDMTDPELLNLALSFGLPVFAAVAVGDQTVDMKKGWVEEDF